jgi:hypothetical protein
VAERAAVLDACISAGICFSEINNAMKDKHLNDPVTINMERRKMMTVKVKIYSDFV